MKSAKVFAIILFCYCLIQHAGLNAQGKAIQPDSIVDFPEKVLQRIDAKSEKVEAGICKSSEKYLNKLSKIEAKLKRKLYKIDSISAKTLFQVDAGQQYQAYLQKIVGDSSKINRVMSGEYFPFIDSIQGLLGFAAKNTQALKVTSLLPGQISTTLGKFNQVQSKLQQAEQVKLFIQQRKEQIHEYLSKMTRVPSGISKTYKNYYKQYYNYKQQIYSYKESLNDPDKLVRVALTLMNKLPSFNRFMQRNSFLSALMIIPGDYASNEQITGLPGRQDVLASFQQQGGFGAPNNAQSVIQKSITDAQGQLDELRQKMDQLSGAKEDLEMPDFQPSTQQTKSFLKRLEYGSDIQTVKGNMFFPVTTDLGLSVGYKLDDKNVIGLGMSYKFGLGQDIRHLAFSSEGIGLRSFLAIHLKRNFFISGGFEYNYQQPFNELVQLKEFNSWQKSGLVGATKSISLKSKVFKKTKLQLLWDFLSYYQVPRTQPIKFRIGYNF